MHFNTPFQMPSYELIPQLNIVNMMRNIMS